MAAHTAHSATHYSQGLTLVVRNERSAVSVPNQPSPDRPLGVFRGLIFAVLVQALMGFAGYAGWTFLRRLF